MRTLFYMKTTILYLRAMLFASLLWVGLILTSCETSTPVDDEDSEIVAVEYVELNTSSLIMTVGESSKVIATVYPLDASVKNVSWSSSKDSIASVSSEGVVTALSVGVTTIIAITEDGYKTATCEVEVVELPSHDKNHIIENVITTPTTVTFKGRVNCKQSPDFKVGVLCSEDQIHEETASIVTTYQLDESGAFELTLSRLKCNTTYKYISFVQLEGIKEYSEEMSFSTDPVEIEVTWNDDAQCYKGRINFTESDGGIQYGMLFSEDPEFNTGNTKEFWASYDVETQYNEYREFLILPTGVYGKQYFKTLYCYYDGREKIYTYGNVQEGNFPYPVFLQKSFIATFSEYASPFSYKMETELPEMMKRAYKDGVCSDYLYMMSIYGLGSDKYAIYIDGEKYSGRDVNCGGYPYFAIDNEVSGYYTDDDLIFDYLSRAEGTKIDCGISMESQIDNNMIKVDAKFLSMVPSRMLVSVYVVENPIIGKQSGANTDYFYHPYVARYMSHTLLKGEPLSLDRNKEELMQFNIEIGPDWNLENCYIYVILKSRAGKVNNVNMGRIGELSD